LGRQSGLLKHGDREKEISTFNGTSNRSFKMIHLQNTKEVLPVVGVAVTAGQTTTGAIDTLGYDYCLVSVIQGTAGATTAPIMCKLSEGDTSTAFTDITDFVGDTATSTSAGYVLATTVSTAGAIIASLGVNTKARKRYLKLSATPGTTANITGHAILSRAETCPSTATLRGVSVQQFA
jgi:hypothetical protein